VHQIRFGRVSASDPAGGAYDTPVDPLTGLRETLLLRGGDGSGGEGRNESEEKRERKGEGRGVRGKGGREGK